MTKLAFVDTETTGLDPDLHEIWEVGLILREENGHETEQRWLLPVDLGRADPYALQIGGFHERHPKGHRYKGSKPPYLCTELWDFARHFAKLTQGAHLVGAVISFDEERLRKLLKASGACAEWHYHLVDVESLAAGRLQIEPPWDSDTLSLAAGVVPPGDERHTALGDARWAMELYDAVMRPQSDEDRIRSESL